MATSTPNISEFNQEASQASPSQPTQAGRSQDRTQDSPTAPLDAVQIPKDYEGKLLDIVEKKTREYAIPRRRRIRTVLRSNEYFKGNQYLSWDEDFSSWFDPLESLFDGDPEKEDLGVFRYVNNVHQMLALSFVAALSPQVPKTQYMPADAERLEDLATAKAASRLQQIIERQNVIANVQKKELMLLWTNGVYFKYHRFLVDANRNQTHREPQWGMVPGKDPDRYICPSCGANTQADSVDPSFQAQCTGNDDQPGCGGQLSPSDFYPGEPYEAPQITGYKDVPNGRMCMDVEGMLSVTVAPWAENLYDSPMLRYDKEIDLGAIRSAYPEKWDELKTGGQDSNPDSMNERMARQRTINMIGGRNNMTTAEMPTFSRTWLQPQAFADMEERKICDWFKQTFPDGCMVVHVGRTVLEVRKSAMRDCWTWCRTTEGFGAYPPAVGDCVLDPQDQINDSSNSMSEHMDRNANGVVLVDGSAIDPRKMNNKPMLAGAWNEVPLKSAAGNKKLSEVIHQLTFSQDPHIGEYREKLLLFAQLVSGVLPQIFGGSDSNVKTASGQRQQLNTSLGRLGLFWENIRQEHAVSSGLSVRIAAKSYTGDILDVIATGDQEFRNEYVRINDLSGEFHAYAETDQGFPQTYAEIQQRLMDMFAQAQGAIGEQLMGEILEEPANQKTIARYLLPENIVLPKDADRIKCMKNINKLLASAPATIPGPMGQPVQVPSVLIDQDYDVDALDVIIMLVRQHAVENPDLEQENPPGWANMKAYYRMAKELQQMQQAQAALQMQAAAGPPPEPGKDAKGKPAPKPPSGPGVPPALGPGAGTPSAPVVGGT